ncbi:YMGG-like glycine zipper-containing protein [Hymenobacter psychrotolerans]|uniref:Glycine zipper n=1 Tax=Hymenobacter psychrotolerans DSM 18569 TaxID=1121959 RepID=A0A1M6YEQ8_9BACT|nr:YMGG-like glycine zipper-containing protein [Hymenobacter psychrotolerans]SHL16777.1 Glycine zipper [Hymenobacter psychrotolerans DSM 18569]
MKTLKIYVAMLSAVLMLGGTVASPEVQAQTKKGWSKKAKGAAIGGGAGAATGAVVGGGKGAIVGGVVGAAAGGVIGRKKDKKKDPVRYQEYSKKD